jgi:UDP-N-acetylmuramoyl-tripeptide--D-alanyl-D-alanine ligase
VIDEAHATELSGAGPLFVVKDVQQSLESLGQRARERSTAFIAAITGSVGKTSTKDMTRLMLSRFGETHASAASYNNHWGVPLTLARMPAESRFGVFELGMNHAGEIAALVAQVRPHVAVITRIAPVHLEYFGTIEKIADAKAEIFSALDGGVAIINRDDGFYERLAAAAAPTASHVFGFGETEGAHARLLSYEPAGEGALVEADILERRLRFRIGAPGKHIAMNALAALLVGVIFDVDLEQAAAAFADFMPPSGRGQREKISTRDGEFTLIDESYNANPTSMRAALQLLSAAATGPGGRRIAILGDMLELGPQAAELHADLAQDLIDANVDLLFTSGPLMSRLSYAAPDSMRGAHRATPLELEEAVLAAVRPGDVVMVKGSNGSRMGRIVSALKSAFAREMAS